MSIADRDRLFELRRDDQLDADELIRLLDHLDACPECLAVWKEWYEPKGTPVQVFPFGETKPEVMPQFPAHPRHPNGCLGRYLMGEVLSRDGGFAIVYRAFDPVLERAVAVKVLRPEIARRREMHARFVREARRMAGVRHPHVVFVHEVLEASVTGFPCPAIVMDLLPGGSLKEARAAGPLPPRRAAECVRQAAAALAAMHVARPPLVHRDIKPANLLLGTDPITGREVVQVGDFGIAASLEESQTPVQQSGQGTLDFDSPEQRARWVVQMPSDVYSLARTLCHLVGARPPVEAAEVPHLTDEERGRRGRLPGELRAVVRRCLRTRPEERYTAAELEEDLRRYLNHEPVRATWHTPFGLFWRWRRTNPVAFDLTLALALLGLIGLTGLAIEVGTRRRVAALLQRDSQAMSGSMKSHIDREQRAEAKRLLDEILEVREALVRLVPDEPEYRYDLAQARMHRANWLQTSHEKPEVEASVAVFTQALGEFRELVRRHPDHAKYRYQLANTLDNRGRAYFHLGAAANAEADHLAALAERTELAAYPDGATESYRGDLASTLNHLANVSQLLNKADAADGYYRQSVAAFDALCLEFPESPSHARDLADPCINYATLLANGRKVDEAKRLLQLTIDRLRPWTTRPERLPVDDAKVGAALFLLGQIAQEQKELAAALGHYEAGVAALERSLAQPRDVALAPGLLKLTQTARFECLLAAGRDGDALEVVRGLCYTRRVPPADLVGMLQALAGRVGAKSEEAKALLAALADRAFDAVREREDFRAVKKAVESKVAN